MVSAYFNTPTANELDERIAAGLLLLIGITPDIKDPKNGVTIPPFRPTENYHFETKGPGIIAALSVCMVILTVVTFLRLGIRFFAHGVRVGADDWLIIPAYLLSMAYPALQIAMVKYGGAGKHFYDITYQEYFHYKYLAPSAATVFYVYVGLVKMSIALFNIRLTTLTTSFWKNVNRAFFVICTLYTIAALFLNIFKCTPQYASFNLLRIAESGKVPHCLSVNAMNSILRINLALDFTALAIPLIVLWKVQLTWKKKARIFSLLSIGLIACIASVMTLVSQYTLERDPLWNYTTLLAWIMVEIVVSLVAACAPTLAYLLPRSMFTKPYASTSASRFTGQKSTTGFGTRGAKDDYVLRTRPVEEDGESEEERRIIVKEQIEMEWQDSGRGEHGAGLGSQGSGGSGDLAGFAGWDADQGAKTDAGIFDGRQPGESMRAWVSTDRSSRNGLGRRTHPEDVV